MKINKYPDGTSYVQIEADDDRETPVWRLNSYDDLWTLHQYVDAYNFKYNKKPVVIIPFLIDAQADRRFKDNESTGLKLVCRFLNSMNAHFRVHHPHNQEVVEGLMDNVTFMKSTYLVSKAITSIDRSFRHTDKNPTDNLILMSSDAGGFKPLMKLADSIQWTGETHSCSKSRSYDGAKSTLVQTIGREDFNGKDILIVDDICVYGGTFKGLAKLLRERNCGKLYLCVSHMTVKDLGPDPVTNYFTKVFTTNSKFDTYDYLNIEPEDRNLEVISLF